MDLTPIPTTSVLITSNPILSIMSTQRDHDDDAEQIRQRDAIIIKAQNDKRYRDAYDEAEAFFNTMYPLAVKHAKIILGKHKSKQKVDNIMFTERLLQGYLGTWNVLLSRKYK